MPTLLLISLLALASCTDYLKGGIAIKITNEFMENLKLNVLKSAFDSVKDVNFSFAKQYDAGLFQANMEMLL